MSPRSYRVDWAEVARRDLLAIVDYLVERNPDIALSTLDRLERRAAALKRSPERGRVIPELERLQLREYRELIVAPYRLVYRVSGRQVLVLGVLDSRRNLEDLLLDRLVGGGLKADGRPWIALSALRIARVERFRRAVMSGDASAPPTAGRRRSSSRTRREGARVSWIGWNLWARTFGDPRTGQLVAEAAAYVAGTAVAFLWVLRSLRYRAAVGPVGGVLDPAYEVDR